MRTHERNGAVAGTVGLMMLIMLAGKGLGIIRDRLQGVYLGADTAEAIAFMQASSLPRNFLDIMFASVFSASFIPVFNAYLETKDKKAAYDLAALFISVTWVLTTVFTVVCILFSPAIYAVFLDGAALSADTRALGITLLRVMFPIMILSGLAFSLTGILQSMGAFNIPAAMSVVSNGIIILYYVFFMDRFGVYGLCAAFLLGWLSQSLIQIPFLIKHRFPFRFRFNLRDPGLRQIAALALPVMAASWVGPVNLLVNAKAAVNLYDGKFGYNAIHFANNLYTIISGVFVLSLANVIFPLLSKQIAAGDGAGFAQTLRSALRSLFFWLLPMSLGLMAVGRPLVRLVYEGGLFTEEAVDITGAALVFFSPGIVGYGLQIVLSRTCYALRDGRTPLISTGLAVALNAVLSFGLAPRMAVAGPALASALSITAAAAYMLWVLARRGHVVWKAAMTVDLMKMAAMALVMFGLARLCGAWLNGYWLAGVSFAPPMGDGLPARVLAVGLPAAVGGVVYIGGCWALGIGEVKDFAERVLKRKG